MAFTVLTAVLYIIKRSGNKKLRRVFSRIHISVGVLLIVAGILHGVLAGNAAGASLDEMMVAPLLFTWNWGTVCLVAAILLALTYMFRRRLKKWWMKLHRVLTIAMIALVVIHVADVGVQIFDYALPVSYAETLTAEDTAEENSIPIETEALMDDVNLQFSGVTLTDGIYEGSAEGYSGIITVSVTVSGGMVSDIEVIGETETPQYFRRAEAMIDTILTQQSLAVDAVSGATYSSAGIVNAVSDALSMAVTDGTLEVTEYTYETRHGRHRN